MRIAIVVGFVAGLGLFVPAFGAETPAVPETPAPPATPTAPPVSSDPVFDGVAAMPGAVEDVRIGGTWEKDERSGAYRIVIARIGGETVTARLFVQWVAYTEEGANVESTLEIKELTDKQVDIVDYTSESDADGLSVYIDTINPTGDGEENFELHVTSPSEYRFGPASN